VALWLRPASVSSTKHEWVGSLLMGWRWLASGFRAHRVARAGFRAALIILLLLWGTGLVLFLRSSRIASVTLPSFAPHPTDEHNLAAAIYGPTIRVSSYYRDFPSQHHPAFLVDGRDRPTTVEKWASDNGDAAPWVEIKWRGSHNVSRVVIRHGGSVESDDMTSRSYRITCMQTSGQSSTLKVEDNTAKRAEHNLGCPAALGVRVDFLPNSKNALTRIYEIEAWGR